MRCDSIPGEFYDAALYGVAATVGRMHLHVVLSSAVNAFDWIPLVVEAVLTVCFG